MANMKIDLSKYANMNICVAVSGGRDSMALLHYLLAHGGQFGISVTALNCDHKMRGESSAKDSAFVKEYCRECGVPLLFYEWDEGVQKTESTARMWRRERYVEAAKHFNATIATAHHLNDNAETVLFNLARGSGLSGMTGIEDGKICQTVGTCAVIRPLIGCSRKEIDAYIEQNNIPYVDDQTNFTDDYTRNQIRHNVLPELERAVPNAAKAIHRFSHIAAEDEEYFKNLIEERGLVKHTPLGYEVAHCHEKPVFKRAVLQILTSRSIKDYTSEHLERLYGLQFAENGKRFEFLGLTAFKEEGKIAIRVDFLHKTYDISCPFFKEGSITLSGQLVHIGQRINVDGDGLGEFINPKTLKFDIDKIPNDAVIRFMRQGDKFKKFGGGTKNLGDYFTDKKIPVRIRNYIPVIAYGNQILVACGVEISDDVKVGDDTTNVSICIAEDYANLSK